MYTWRGRGRSGDYAAPTSVWTVGIRDDSSSSRSNIPFLFRVPLQAGSTGAASIGNTLTATVSGSSQPIQVDARTIGQDGELTGATIAGVLSNLGSGETKNISLSLGAGSDLSGTPITWSDVLATGWNRSVEAVVGGTTYTADPTTCTTSDTTYAAADPHYRGTFLSGPFCTCFILSVPFDNSGSRPSDFLRAQYHVYAFKAGTGAVDGGNPIIAIMTDVVVGNEAFDPTSWGDVSITTLTIKDEVDSTVSTWSSVTAYARAADDLGGPYWWSNDATARGQWTPIHETVSNKLQKFIDYGWFLPTPVASSNVSAINSTWNATLIGQSTVPFASLGIHVTDQGGTGAREDIDIIHRVEHLALINYTDTTRQNISLNTRSAKHIPWRWRDQATGLMLDITNASREDDYEGTSTAPSPDANQFINTDLAHKPCDGYLLYNTTGLFKYLEMLHFGAQFVWMANQFGPGVNRRLTYSIQARATGWGIRSVMLALACTPNSLSNNITGWNRALLQSYLDAGCGSANGETSFGFYHGAKNEYWDASQTGAIPISGKFDNDDGANARWIYHNDTTFSSWMTNFVCWSLVLAKRLNVLNADGVSFMDWILEFIPRYMDSGYADAMLEQYYGVVTTAINAPPKTWLELLRDDAQLISGDHGIIGDQGALNITSYDIDASTPSAVTVQFNGASAVSYFDDGETTQGDWFLGNGTYSAGDGLRIIVNGGRGRITAVDGDGKGCTFDSTVIGGATPTTSSGIAASSLRLPVWGPNSPWLTAQIYNAGSPDYASMAESTLRLVKLMNPSRTNIDTYINYVHTRNISVLNSYNDPIQDGDSYLHNAFGDWS